MEKQLKSQYLTKEQCARALGVPTRTLNRWHALRKGPPRTRAGRRVLYRMSGITQWLEHNEQKNDLAERAAGGGR